MLLVDGSPSPLSLSLSHSGDWLACAISAVPVRANTFATSGTFISARSICACIATDCSSPVPGMRSAGTADWAGIFNSYYWIDRKKGIGGVLMTQMLPFFDARVVETLIGFETAVYQQVGAVVPAA